MRIELSKIRKFRTRKRVVICYPGANIDLIKDRLEVAYRSWGGTLHVRGNSIRNRGGTFERSEILLRKYMELLVRSKELGKIICLYDWNFT